jgi:hypothetical protein
MRITALEIATPGSDPNRENRGLTRRASSTIKPTPIPTFPLKVPTGPRAVNERRETKVSLRYLLSFKPTPIPTLPLKGKESYPRRGSQKHSLPLRGRVRVGVGYACSHLPPPTSRLTLT